MEQPGPVDSDALRHGPQNALLAEQSGEDAVPPPRRRWLTAFLIAALPALMFINVWRAGGLATGLDDLIYYLPVRAYIGQELRAGRLPMWNPYVAMGAPLAADPQAGLWYPFTWLFAVLPALVAYSVNIWVHYVLAGWGMYRFLRALGRCWHAALLGAIAFEFSPYLISHREHLTILQATAWIPWMLFSWQRYAGEARTSKGESSIAGRSSCYVPLAAALWGLQLLVQHIQPSIMTAALVGAYVLIVLRPQRPGIGWAWLAVTASGAVLAAVQWLPTWHLFAGSGRGSAAYHLFIENSWTPASVFMFLFPMLYGNAVPDVWGEWWGVSHLSEQWPYATLVILALTIASLGLARAPGQPQAGRAGWNREVLFWWAACLAALLIALGHLTPLSKLLFHVPVYRNLRVPARWILVWSVGMPVLAALVVDAIARGGTLGERARRWIRYSATRVLPALIAIALLLMHLAALLSRVGGRLLSREQVRAFLDGMRRAVWSLNPAILIPLLQAAITIAALVYWSRRPSLRRFAPVGLVLLADLAWVAPFVAVDTRGYTAREVLEPPPLARTIQARGPDAGHRLLVPRFNASYQRPIEILWPQTNMLHHLPTLNGYGPLGDIAQRLLLAFMPWGSSEEILSLLRRPALLRRLGVRFFAVRSPEEREFLSAALAPPIAEPQWQEIAGTQEMRPVGSDEGLLCPVRIDSPGIYQIELDAAPVPASASRWFVALEGLDHHQHHARTHTVEPADLSCGPRRMRFLFLCRAAPGLALVRVKSEFGQALSAGRVRFAQVAAVRPPGEHRSSAQSREPFARLDELPGGLTLFELSEANGLVWTPSRIEAARDLAEAVEWLLGPAGTAPAGVAAVEGVTEARNLLPPARLRHSRFGPNEIRVEVTSSSDQWIVLNESWNPGWRARVDGRPARLHRVNAVTQGVWLPPGSHAVEFVYFSPGLRAGAVCSGLGWSCLALLAVLQTRRRRRA